MVFQSRYGGAYEGGEWFAISGFENLSSGLLEYFEGEDEDAVSFWSKEHDFPIATGNTPNEAVNLLLANYSKTTNDSVPYKKVIESTSMNKPEYTSFSNTHIERTSFYERSMGFANDK
jgi:hypothetical protein